MAKRTRRRSIRRRRRGMGSVISVRRKGMGALKGTTGAVVAPLLGGAVTALTTLGIRYYVKPDTETNISVLKYSWAIGHGAGLLASLALYFLGDKSNRMALAASSATAATAVGLFALASDKSTPDAVRAVLAASSSAAASGSEAADQAAMQQAASPTQGTTPGFGAIVYNQLGAIVPEYQGMNGLGGDYGSYGQSVSLRGVDTRVFGSSPF